MVGRLRSSEGPPSKITVGSPQISWFLPSCMLVRAEKSEEKPRRWGR